MFGLTIVKKSFISRLNEAISACNEKNESGAKYIKTMEAEIVSNNQLISDLKGVISKAEAKIEELTKNTFKATRELSECRDAYKRSVEEKEDLKKLVISKDATIKAFKLKLDFLTGQVKEDITGEGTTHGEVDGMDSVGEDMAGDTVEEIKPDEIVVVEREERKKKRKKNRNTDKRHENDHV